ncbi:MAG: YdcF family protein [Deltaproteobacteria bacterium]
MEQIYDVFKSFVDPVFVIFILLLISFLICLITGKKKGGALLIFLTIVLLYGLSIAPVSNYLSYKVEKEFIRNNPVEEKKPLDVIAVLGGGSYDIQALGKTFPSDQTTVRLVHAVQMYQEYHAKYLVCSGKGSGKISEAALLAQMAETFGIPRERIRIEAKSENTYEHAVEFNKMFIDKDIRIGLVTSAFHLKRSETEFRKYFSNVVPLPASYLYASPAGNPAIRYVPQSQWLVNNTLILREHVSRLWYKIKDI